MNINLPAQNLKKQKNLYSHFFENLHIAIGANYSDFYTTNGTAKIGPSALIVKERLNHQRLSLQYGIVYNKSKLYLKNKRITDDYSRKYLQIADIEADFHLFEPIGLINVDVLSKRKYKIKSYAGVGYSININNNNMTNIRSRSDTTYNTPVTDYDYCYLFEGRPAMLENSGFVYHIGTDLIFLRFIGKIMYSNYQHPLNRIGYQIYFGERIQMIQILLGIKL
jgi:hypothetical protein